MDPVTLTVAGWLVQQAASQLFARTKDILLQRLGLSPDLTFASVKLDRDRIDKLPEALNMLKDASKKVAQRGLLFEALGDFHEIVQIPQQGKTGGRPNAELRCMAFVGMAASYILILRDHPALIAEKMVEAVRADATTAKQRLGEEFVREILARLNSGQRPPLPPLSQASILVLRRLPKPIAFRLAPVIGGGGLTGMNLEVASEPSFK